MTREEALVLPYEVAVLAVGVGRVIKRQQLPCWHAEPLMHLQPKQVIQVLFWKNGTGNAR